MVRPTRHLLQGSSQRREYLYYSATNVDARRNVGFGFISPNGSGALTRFAGHTTQGSKRIRIHLLPSERLERYRDRQAGQDSAAEIRPGMARRPPWLQASSLTGSKGHGRGSSSVRIPQTREAICNQRRIGRERTRRAPKITHKMNSPCRKRTAVASAE